MKSRVCFSFFFFPPPKKNNTDFTKWFHFYFHSFIYLFIYWGIGTITDLWINCLFQEIVPPRLLENFLTMVDPALSQSVDSDITRHCAYNFPAVAYTLGRHNWHCLKSLFETLAADMQVSVSITSMIPTSLPTPCPLFFFFFFFYILSPMWKVRTGLWSFNSLNRSSLSSFYFLTGTFFFFFLFFFFFFFFFFF